MITKYLVTVDTLNKYRRYENTCPEVIAVIVNKHVDTGMHNIGVVDSIRDLEGIEGRGARFTNPSDPTSTNFVQVEVIS